MIKKLNLGLFIVALSVLFGANMAHAANLTYTDDTFVTINSRTYYIAAGSGATSVVVNPTTLVVTVPAATTFTLKSLVGDTLTNDAVIPTSCSDTTSVVMLTSAATVTFTPTSVQVCSTAAPAGGGGIVGSGGDSSSSSSSSDSSSSSSSSTITPPAVTLSVSPSVTVTSTTSTVPGCSSMSGFSTTNGQPCSGATTVSTSTTYNLGTFTLKNGSTGESVKQLQKLLNKILKLGLKEDGKLGPKTIAVIKKWQKEHGLKADGLVGAKTKEKMKAEAEMN